MYIDNIKKLHDDLSKIIFVKDEIEAADADGEGHNLHTLISIIDKYINSNIWNIHSFEFINEVGDWEDEDADLSDVFWPYADTVIEMKDKLRKDYNKLVRIDYRLKEELKVK